MNSHNNKLGQRWYKTYNANLFLVVVFILSLTNCTIYEIKRVVDENTDFSAYKTYTWLEEGQTVEGAFTIETEQLKSLIGEAIETELRQKGLVKANIPNSDIYVSYYASQRNISYNEPQYYYSLADINQNYTIKDIHYSSSFDASRRYAPSDERGVLVIDMIDRSNSRLVWRGVVEAPFGASKTEEGQIQRLNKAVNKLFENFPPKQIH